MAAVEKVGTGAQRMRQGEPRGGGGDWRTGRAMAVAEEPRTVVAARRRKRRQGWRTKR